MGVLREAFELANTAVRRARMHDDALDNMATTLIGAVFVDSHVVVASVGDSRAYRLRRTRLKQVTADHVAYHDELTGLSEEDISAVRPLLQRLTRAVGHQDGGEPDLWVQPASAEDLFLFCSNGLSDVLERSRIGELLLDCESLESACDRLISAARSAGAEDDVTVVLARPIDASGGHTR